MTNIKLFVIFTLSSVSVLTAAKLPNDLDGFLGVLFETPECEPFISDSTYLGVETSKCDPYTCDFPRQLCMRISDKYQDPSANECREIPSDCLTAANGGVPLGPIRQSKSNRPVPSPSPALGLVNPADRINGQRPPPVKIVTAGPDLVIATNPPPPPPPLPKSSFGDICSQSAPDGRFCGFALKFTFNKETGNCEQFWFPGCRTDLTNDNLFESENDCRAATRHCGESPPPTPKPMRIRVPTPKTVMTTTPKPTKKPRSTTPEPEYPDPDIGVVVPPRKNTGSVGGVDLGSLAKSFMGGGTGGGLVGQFLGTGLGGGPAPTSSSIPNGYGRANLGGGEFNRGGNFISLIASTVKELGDKKAQGQHGGGNVARVAQQWLNPNQLGSLFSGLWV
ncbi:hypothetical protein FO519_000167 [Halicephalobus sp. NKZ332]|nr:hypothetical protein FO519_000167 [Halicephalobus sp. NKZ332]